MASDGLSDPFDDMSLGESWWCTPWPADMWASTQWCWLVHPPDPPPICEDVPNATLAACIDKMGIASSEQRSQAHRICKVA